MNEYPEAITDSLDKAEEYILKSRGAMPRVEHYRLILKAWFLADKARKILNESIYLPADLPREQPAAESKLRISYIQIIDGRPHASRYGIDDLNRIGGWLNCGRDNISPDELFNRGWHFDNLERLVRNRIGWDRMHLSLLKELA